MKARRQIRAVLPGFSLALPSEGAHGEVQVQQQNEKEVNKFFIDVDDSMVSPMITTNPSKVSGGSAAVGTFHARPFVPASAPQQAHGQPVAARRVGEHVQVGSYAAALTAPSPHHHGGAARRDGPDAGQGGGNGSSTAGGNTNTGPATAKFIHVHNTNLFVLMDGVSMFLDGKSTYTGNQDPSLLALLERKKQEKREKKERKAREQATDTSGALHPGSPVDTVEKAIRDIEDNVSLIASPVHQCHPRPPTRPDGSKAPAKSAPTVPSSLDLDEKSSSVTATPVPSTLPALSSAQAGTGGFAPPAAAKPIPKVPSQFASLFVNATRPVGSPLFGHQRANAPTATPPVSSFASTTSGAATATNTSTPMTTTAPTPAKSLLFAENGVVNEINNGMRSSLVVPCGAMAAPSPAGTPQVGNSSFSSQASSSQMPRMGRQGSSVSVNTMADTASQANWETGSATNVWLHRDRYPSLPGASPLPAGSTVSSKRSKPAPSKPVTPAAKVKPVSVDDIGHSNRSLDIDEVEYLDLIGTGSQGKVFCVKLDGKHYALKCIDVKEATEATNSVERQGRKRGLVKELNMIRLQRERPQPKYLMQMFNAVANLDGNNQQLNLLIELMSFGVEDCQKMVARIPQSEMMAMTQSTFRDYMAGDARSQQDSEKLLKQQHGSCMHVLGRSSHLVPQTWELNVERQTSMPEIVLSMLAADVLKGLRELHQDYGMVHCDLKPANVLLCFDRQSFKLADFGCSSVMDPETKRVRRRGVDLGSKLYKAPERLSGELPSDVTAMLLLDNPARDRNGHDDEEEAGAGEVIDFSAKADVWSLGIMLLELSCGVHPCDAFKSDFWNYRNQLKLAKMIKPLTWSPAFCDFVVRCVAVDENKRWSVKQLLSHPFVLKTQSVPRAKLRNFMARLEKDSATFQRRQQREALQKQIQLSTAQIAMDNHTRVGKARWGQYNAPLKVAPDWRDLRQFPALE